MELINFESINMRGTIRNTFVTDALDSKIKLFVI